MASDSTSEATRWSRPRLVAIVGLMLALVIVELVGLYARWLVATTIMTFAMCGIGAWLLRRPGDATEKLLNSLFRWATYWLVLGIIFEPYEGGIKKDHPTMSYYFVTTGLAICALIAFTIVLDVLKRRRWATLFTENGQNPMIAYAGINNFVLPLIALTPLEAMISSWSTSPLVGLVNGLFITLLVAIATSYCTRRRIFWRS